MLDQFKDAMAALPSGVVIVSTRDRAGFRGLTASSFTSVSLAPPLVLVCLDHFAQTRDAIAASGLFNVSILERGQEFLADRFAGRAPVVDPAWREVPHLLGANGLPVVRGCVAWFECELLDVYPAGDHDIFVGRVTQAGRDSGEPLVSWDRAFWRLC
ncbi:MAG TPA: flavin reductase family protein [Candidatus Dormibacteraeota bacterium]|nr:flavin reductase family protein [Candidatus Dormibacteraeota bacterium]